MVTPLTTRRHCRDTGRALEIDPDLVPAIINLANIHYSRNEIAEAQALYERAIGLEPEVFEAHFNLGNIFHDLGRYSDARVCYRDAIQLNPTYADAHFYLAVTLEKNGQSQEARLHWKAYQELAPQWGMGAPGQRVFGLVAVLVRVSFLRRPPQLVILAVDTPRVGIEPCRARVGLDLAMRAEGGGDAFFHRLLPPHEVKRTNPVDCGAEGVGVPSVVVGVASAGSSLGGPMGPLLKLDANGFLQRAERANLFG
jgi:tetratricopeptide (TPR) repeat protein